MNAGSYRKTILPWVKKGGFLVALQFVLLLAFILLPVYPSSTGFEIFSTVTMLRWTTLTACWVVAILFGTLGSYQIKHSLTPLPYPVKDNQLVTTGIYALVRHPLYSSQLFAAFGWAVFHMSLSHIIMTGLGFLFFNYKSSREEGWLTELHPEYTDYAQHVHKFIPWIY